MKPDNSVAAIVNETDTDARYSRQTNYNDDHSLVDLPEGMPKELFKTLKKVWVSGQQLKISKVEKQTSFEKFEKRGRNKTTATQQKAKVKPLLKNQTTRNIIPKLSA